MSFEVCPICGYKDTSKVSLQHNIMNTYINVDKPSDHFISNSTKEQIVRTIGEGETEKKITYLRADKYEAHVKAKTVNEPRPPTTGTGATTKPQGFTGQKVS